LQTEFPDVVVDLIYELFKFVDMVIDCGFLVLFDVCEIVGCADIFEVGRAAIFIVDMLPNGGNIILHIV